MFSHFWHPSLLLFLATVAFPVFLFLRGKALSIADRGHHPIICGGGILACATFLDYAEELPWGARLLSALTGVSDLDSEILPYLYLPGVLLVTWGVARWLPAVHALEREACRRHAAEEELKSLVEEMRTLALRAEEASRSKAEFLATMGHELRTPLNAVIGFSEMLQQDMNVTRDKHQEYLDIVANSGRHLLSIINDILDMSRLEAGRVIAEPTMFDLDEVVQECIDFHQRVIDEKQLELRLECGTGQVCSDRRMTKQIVLNVLSNAIKFTPEVGRVTVVGVIRDASFGLTITDTGVGMTDDEMAQAMKPFVQVDTRLSRLYEGTGLGLPLVEKFCQLLEGRMKIDSVKWEGTQVTIDLPCLNAANDGDQLLTGCRLHEDEEAVI
ncbi:sensor histidine kinase [Kordiimonas sp.]|uniref:sensor histidine kinase n=1 Tax=Kordiimonas sp. TaxID=1970157 RepID=UPI003A945B15